MRIVPTLIWTLEGGSAEALDPRLVPLLQAIAASDSLAAAVVECGISYRAAWGLLREYQRKLGEPLVLFERGRGATLTTSGQKLIGAEKAARLRLARILPGLAAEIGSPPSAEERAATRVLRVAASHDLALAALASELPPGSGVSLDVSFMGSLLALEEFSEGRAEIAGFHVAISGGQDWDRALFLRGLRKGRDRLIRFVDRDQGLMLPHGNPSQAKGFGDIAGRRLRFINRQRGSGTRLLIDQMLAREKIDSSDIVGYGTEEFTHRAIAATVASGRADAGFGLRAAAAEHRLAFVPLVRERYFLAVRAKAAETIAVAKLIQMLRSPAFVRIVRKLAGYRADAAGSIVGVDALGTTVKT